MKTLFEDLEALEVMVALREREVQQAQEALDAALNRYGQAIARRTTAHLEGRVVGHEPGS